MLDVLHLTEPTPFSLGFRMPAEWAEHAATWTSWPSDDELWFGHLDAVRKEFAELVKTIARFEPVHVLVRDDEAHSDATTRLAGVPGLTFHKVPLDDVWFRDNGPIFIKRGEDLSFVNWVFNSWGEKFNWHNDNAAPEAVAEYLDIAHWDVDVVMEGGSLEVNGLGLCMTTKQCLLEPKRNPGLTPEQLEQHLKDHLGITKMLWLEDGLENDHTDGHIDTIIRFVNETTVVCSVEPNPEDPNHATMQRNLDLLKTFTDQDGNPLTIVELPLPKNRLELDGDRLPPTYANFYIGNGFVVVPTYGDPNDQAALDILQAVFPDREVIGLSSRAIINGGGSFHCVTQQQPKGVVWKG